jgi:hypothetical protein
MRGDLVTAGNGRARLAELEGQLGELTAELARRRAVRWAGTAARFRYEGAARLRIVTFGVAASVAGESEHLVEHRFDLRLRSRPASTAKILG